MSIKTPGRIASLTIITTLALAACSSSDENTPDTAAPVTTAAPATAEETTTTAASTSEETTETSAAPSAAPVVIYDSWARSMPTGMGASYGVIVVDADDRLLSASVDPTIAAAAEIHEVVMGDDGAMKMQEVDGIDLVAGEPLVLMPGSFHIMLMGMTEVRAPGTAFEITLTFENAGDFTYTTVVAEQNDGMADMEGDMHMDDSMEGDMGESMDDDMGGDMDTAPSEPAEG